MLAPERRHSRGFWCWDRIGRPRHHLQRSVQFDLSDHVIAYQILIQKIYSFLFKCFDLQKSIQFNLSDHVIAYHMLRLNKH